MWVLLFLSLLVTIVSAQFVDDGNYDMLFIGNSYIYTGELQDVVKALLAEAFDIPANTEHNVLRLGGPGAKWYQAAASQTHLNYIRSSDYNWKWILLQEQSQTAGFWGTYFPDYETSMEAVIQLHEVIEQEANGDPETILMMTWGRRNGDARNPGFYPDFKTMTARTAEGYYQYRDAITTPENPVKIAPVGLAYEYIYDALVEEKRQEGIEDFDPGMGGREAGNPPNDFSILYTGDGSHPATPGTYLAACVIFATITGLDPQGLEYYPGGDTGQDTEEFIRLRSYLQSVAAYTVANFEQSDGSQTNNNLSQYVEMFVEITFDNFPNEIGWSILDITDDNNHEILLDFPPRSYQWYEFARQTITEVVVLPRNNGDSTYRFMIMDIEGDGLCCGYGQGEYTVSLEGGEVLLAGGEFDTTDFVDFNL